MPFCAYDRLMSQAQIDDVKIQAVKNVLGTFGYQVFDILKERLLYDYKIMLTDDALFTLEELQIALQRLFGENSSELIMRQIRFEMQELAKEKLR